MATSVIMQEAQEAAKVAVVSSSERSAAKRTLVSWSKKDPTVQSSEANIRLYVALSNLIKARVPNGRVTIQHFQGAKHEAFSASTLKQKVWVVFKHITAILPACVSDYVLDPSALQDIPAGIDPGAVWFIDQVVERSTLGRGVLEFVVSVGTSSKAKVSCSSLADGPVNFPGDAVVPEVAAVQHAALQTVSALATIVVVPQPANKLLVERPIDPAEDVSEYIATEASEAFLRGDVCGLDPNNPQYALFWLKKAVGHSKTEMQASRGLPDHISRFIKFIVRQLLACSDFNALRQFAPVLKETYIV